MLYEHAVKRFGLHHNPMSELERTLVSLKPIRTSALDQVRILLTGAQDPAEQAALELLLGHGWRQIEVRRVTAGDIQAIANNLIEVHGKERRELTPVLPETVEVLKKLAEGLKPPTRFSLPAAYAAGSREPLGEDGMRDLIKRLLERAGICDLAGHDLQADLCHPGEEILRR